MEQKQVSIPAAGGGNAGISPVYFGVALVITGLSFLAGLGIGFFGRPMVLGDKVKVVEVMVTAIPDATAEAVAKAEPPTAVPTASDNNNEGEEVADSPVAEDSNADAAADSNELAPPTIMDLVLADTHHFQGDPDAPITIIEFSDFK